MHTWNDTTTRFSRPTICGSGPRYARFPAGTDTARRHGLHSHDIHSSPYRAGCQLNATASYDVAICGGGLGGLALAVGLRRQGYDAHVFEAAPELRTGTSTMIGLNKNALTALAGLHPDLVPELKAQGAPLAHISLAIKQDKHAVSQYYDYTTSGEAYTMRWAMVQSVLASLLPAEAVHCNHRASGYKEDADRGLVQVTFKDQPAIQARLLVCADGFRSALRQVMIPNDPGPRYLGHMIWNAVVPSSTITDGVPPSSMLLWKDRVLGVPWAVYAGLVDAGGGYTYWMTTIESESPSFTNGSGPGQGVPGVKARVESILRDAGFDHVLKAVQDTPEAAIFERGVNDRIPLDELGATMVSPGGRVVLLGDAAHAMHPEPAHGARTAFEDADTLFRSLNQHQKDLVGWASADAPASPSLDDHRGLQTALVGYNAARLSRVCRIQRYAAEFSGVPALRNKLLPTGLTSDQRGARDAEFGRWTNQYPDNAAGDPASQYWKPIESNP